MLGKDQGDPTRAPPRSHNPRRLTRYYSSYVASRLSVWKTNGKHLLHELLAKMGVSLAQAEQKWTFMSPQLRARVVEQMEVSLRM